MDERALYYNAKKSAQIINVCCALHNICLKFDSDFSIEINELDFEREAASELNVQENLDLDMNEGVSLRNEILEFIT